MKQIDVRRAWGVALACTIAGGGVGWLATHALAEGSPPTPGSLYYSGEVGNVNGTPFTATSAHFVVRLFDRESATGAMMYCQVDAPSTPVSNGHFRIALDPSGYTACRDAVRAHPVVWVEVQVESEALPRQQLGAVPYALEADHSVEAAHAAVATQVTRPVGSAAPVGVAGTVCGYTATATTGDIRGPGGLTGARAARALCQAVSGCSATAHMCTSSEAAISRQLGPLSIPGGRAWVTGAYGAESGLLLNDCASASPYHAWTSALHTQGGATTDNDAPTDEYCDVAHRIACCD